VAKNRQYSLGEEIANAVTHGLGIALSIAALVLLDVAAIIYGNRLTVVSVTVYGATLILLYTASTLYHSLSSTRACHVFKVIDHSAIYLLIAGTYTPFTLVTLAGPWGWSLFAVVWTLAIVGVSLEAFCRDGFSARNPFRS
jgi:hemolysin III